MKKAEIQMKSLLRKQRNEVNKIPGYNFNHFTGKTKSGNPRKNRKKKVRIKKIHRNKYKQ